MLESQIIILVILIFLSSFFSGVETALVSLNMVKVKALVKQKKRGATTLYRIKQNPHKLIITILIGNNLVNIGAASLATVVFMDLFGSKGIAISTGVMTFLILVFGEITPKTFASQNAEKISLFVARPIEFLCYVLFPFVKIFEFISRGITKMTGLKAEKQISEEELRTIVTFGRKEGILSRESAEMMHKVLDFERKRVSEIMTQKVEIEMVDGEEKLKDIINFVVKSPYSKYPVYSENKDKIIGILDVDDILKQAVDKKLEVKVKSIMKPAYIIPDSKEIDDLLAELEHKELPLAIVVDEYGNVDGLVTTEDILEEIVGDIFDKSRKKNTYIKKIGKNLIRADARVSIEEINKIVRLDIKQKRFNTLAGFIEHKLQRIPQEGERIKLKNTIIEIEKVTKQRIKSVKLTKL